MGLRRPRVRYSILPTLRCYSLTPFSLLNTIVLMAAISNYHIGHIWKCGNGWGIMESYVQLLPLSFSLFLSHYSMRYHFTSSPLPPPPSPSLHCTLEKWDATSLCLQAWVRGDRLISHVLSHCEDGREEPLPGDTLRRGMQECQEP